MNGPTISYRLTPFMIFSFVFFFPNRNLILVKYVGLVYYEADLGPLFVTML